VEICTRHFMAHERRSIELWMYARATDLDRADLLTMSQWQFCSFVVKFCQEIIDTNSLIRNYKFT